VSSRKLNRGKRARLERERQNKRQGKSPGRHTEMSSAQFARWKATYDEIMTDLVRRNPGLADDNVPVVVLNTGLFIYKDWATEEDKALAFAAATAKRRASAEWVKPAWAIPDPHDAEQAPSITKPPGHLLLRAIAWFPVKDVREAVMQSIADMREEHFAALQRGDVEEAQKIVARGRISALVMVIPMLIQWLVGLVSLLREWFAAKP
jgi:hypothetical protein